MSGLRDDLRESYRELRGPAPDEIDAAVTILREARRILADGEMMAAVKRRVEESRKAVAQADDVGDDT